MLYAHVIQLGIGLYCPICHEGTFKELILKAIRTHQAQWLRPPAPLGNLILIQTVSNFLPFIAIWHANSLHYYMIHDTTKILPYPPGGYEIFNKHVNILVEMTAHTLSGDKVSPKKGYKLSKSTIYK